MKEEQAASLRRSIIKLISTCLTDEIVDTLGEGTFGKVVQCVDRSRYIRVEPICSVCGLLHS